MIGTLREQLRRLRRRRWLALAVLAGLYALNGASRAETRAYLPDRYKTPGKFLPNVTKEMVCQPGYAGRVRLPMGAKWHSEVRAICLSYGVPYNPKVAEMDHDGSIELGGDPGDPRNIWPEPYDRVVNGEQVGARVKDKIEDRLHSLVCKETIPLFEAQKEITGDWTVAYRHWIGPLPLAETDETPHAFGLTRSSHGTAGMRGKSIILEDFPESSKTITLEGFPESSITVWTAFYNVGDTRNGPLPKGVKPISGYEANKLTSGGR